MLGFSLPKLIVLAAIIAAVWYGFKWVGRYNQVQQAKADDLIRKNAEKSAADMTPCPKCGTYVLTGEATNCGRVGCPY
jgi:hypothetical protein